MKTLYLVRHAKASWKHDVDDHKRPLKKKGQEDGKRVSARVKNEVEPPQKIISSDAIRALSTAYFFKDAFNISEEDFLTVHKLYDFRGTGVMKVIKTLDDNLNTVMLVGHNHAFTSIANMLGDSYIENIPTCGFVKIQFKEDHWKDVSTGETALTIFPRDLKND